MPVFEVQSPDGRKVRVNAPEGATQEQAIAYAQNHIAEQDKVRDSQRAKIAAENAQWGKMGEGDMNFAQKLAVGAFNPLAEMGYGLKQATVGLSPQQETQLQGIRGARDDAGAIGTAGEIAAFLIPGTAAAKAAGLATKGASGVARGAALAGSQGALSGAYEGSRATLEGDPSRLQRTAVGSAAGAVGAALPGLGAKAVKPFMASPASEALEAAARSRGVDLRLTAGQRIGGAVRGVEDTLAAVPVVGPAIRKAQEASAAKWNLKALRDVAAPLERVGIKASITESGDVGIGEAQRAVAAAYKQATDGIVVKSLPSDPIGNSWRAVKGKLPPDQYKEFYREAKNLASEIEGKKIGGGAIKETEKVLRELESGAALNGRTRLKEAYKMLRENYRRTYEASMTQEQRTVLRAADKAYSRMAPINEAASSLGAQKRGGLFTPSDLIRGQAKGSAASVRAGGRVPGAAEARTAHDIFGSTLPTPGPGTAEKIAAMGTLAALGGGAQYLSNGGEGGVPYAGALTPMAAALLFGGGRGGRYLAGQYPMQSSLAQKLLTPEAAAIGGQLPRSLLDY